MAYFRNYDDPDLFVRMTNKLYDEKQKLYHEKRLNEAIEASMNKKPIIDVRRKEKKPSKIPQILISSILLMAISFTAGIKVPRAIEDTFAYHDARHEITQYAEDNYKTGPVYHVDRGEPDWWYEIDKMADDVLNKESIYDIDTRIYGCYVGLKEYKRLDHMNELFYHMQKIISSNPKGYSEEVIRACNYSTFQEYLEDKGLTLEEYKELMKEILTEYGKENRLDDKIASLLAQLNGGVSR